MLGVRKTIDTESSGSNMAGRNFNVTMKTDDGSSRPFYDRHFTSLLTLVGVIIAAVLAISDNGLNIFINQPPGAKIKLTRSNAPVNEKIIARAIVTDPDGSPDEISYKWEILETDTLIDEGVDEALNKVSLPTDKEGNYTVLLTVIDDKGNGKQATSDAQFEVLKAGPAINTQAIDKSGSSNNSSVSPVRLKTISLSKDDIINWDERQAERIVTNGYELAINASLINTPLKIISFDNRSTSGRSGRSGAPGVNGGAQQAGTNGEDGYQGADGGKGQNSSPVTVNVTGPLNANLTIDNSGQKGGIGGNGGKGGPGGSGGQGEPSRQGIFDCRSGPGHGAPGGNGGNGSSGGDGGAGGNAGPVKVYVASQSANGLINVSALGGQGGSPSNGGPGGVPGSGGPEGKTGGFCGPAGRRGPTGASGKPGNSGKRGKSGTDASIHLKVSSKSYVKNGRISFP